MIKLVKNLVISDRKVLKPVQTVNEEEFELADDNEDLCLTVYDDEPSDGSS